MLVRLLPDQLEKYWPYIKESLIGTLPQESFKERGSLNNILESLLSESMQAWMSVGDDAVYALAVTSLYVDTMTKANVMRIVSIYAYANVPESEWAEGMETFVKFAQANECKVLEGFSLNQRMVDIAIQHGWSKDTHLYKEI